MDIRIQHRNIIQEILKHICFSTNYTIETLPDNSQNMFCINLNGREVQHWKLIHKPTKFTEQL